MQNQQTRQLTQGAMMAAIFAVLTAISMNVPLLNVVTTLFLGLPIAWYSAKYPWKASLLFAVVSLILSFIVGGPLSLPLTLSYIPLGLAVGLSIYYRKSKLFMFMCSGIVLLISTVLQYVASIVLFGINVLEESITLMKETYATTGNFLERFGATAVQMEDYNEAVKQMMFSLETLMPTLLVASIFILVWLMLLLYLPILKRLGIAVPKFPPFRDMKLPKSVLWYYLIVVLVSLLTDLQPGTMAYMTFMNAYVLLQLLLFLQGISFYHFYIQQEGWPKWVAVLVTILAIPLQSFTTIIGIVDLGFDIRGWVKRAHEFKGK
ncbi:YybS family protein [Planococcus sp. YIM B11945]|uniref:YybS family protein n=1 Tax=Planococcus sp. YIM B11945 TaxID=3435410 RepID=UPI003D7D3959